MSATTGLGRWGMTWLKIGKSNIWIKEAEDPAFTLESFHVCADRAEFFTKFEHGNWCLGQAWVLGELAFINQVEGGDEYLVIRRGVKFESLSVAHVLRGDGRGPQPEGADDATLRLWMAGRLPRTPAGEAALNAWLDDALAATDEELRSLNYEGAAKRALEVGA